MAVSRVWPGAEQNYRDYHRDHGLGLGLSIFYKVPDANIVIVHMVAQHGTFRLSKPWMFKPGFPYLDHNNTMAPIRYGALGQCMNAVRAFAKETNGDVHCPMFGCGLAGGSWEAVESMIHELWIAWGVPVYVYDKDRKI